jgi:hypothetical protein
MPHSLLRVVLIFVSEVFFVLKSTFLQLRMMCVVCHGQTSCSLFRALLPWYYSLVLIPAIYSPITDILNLELYDGAMFVSEL